VEDRKNFSERLHEIVTDLVGAQGSAKTAADLGLPNNFFSPSKYNLERFSGKHISHLDLIEEYFGIDLLGGSGSALAREIDRAEQEGALSPHDRNAILAIVRAARERALPRGTGAVAVEEVKKRGAARKKKK